MKSNYAMLGVCCLVAFLCSIIRVICYTVDIGLNPIIFGLSECALFGSSALSFIVLLVLAGLFFCCLAALKILKALQCIAFSLIPLFILGVIMPTTGLISKSYLREECANHMQSLGKNLKTHSTQNNGEIPGDDWCDAISIQPDFDPLMLSCRGNFRNHVEGESSYALNINVINSKLLELPSDTVILFEMDYVDDKSNQMIPLGQRKYMFKYELDDPNKTPLIRVGAWNQIDGVELVSCNRHAGLGCNILFADGHVEFVKKEKIANLRWKP